MAPPQILSRTQRRHEQKQTILVLALVAVVALLSFLAGIMVGRGMTPTEPVVAAVPVSAPRLPVPPPPSAIPSQSPAQLPASEAVAAASGSSPDPAGTRPEQLAFYDSLAKGEQPPLGSGINLPPPSAVPSPEPVADVVEMQTPAAVPAPAGKTVVPSAKSAGTTAKTVTPVSKSTPPSTKSPASAKSTDKATSKSVDMAAPGKTEGATAGKKSSRTPSVGSFVIQAASYHKAHEATELSRRLSRKGYTPFVEAIDLGSKGLWHRVYVGPFSNVAAADKVAKRLKSEERLAPVVRKR